MYVHPNKYSHSGPLRFVLSLFPLTLPVFMRLLSTMLMLHFRLYRRGLTTFVINNRLTIQAEMLVLEKALSCCGLLELHAMNRYQLEGQAELGTVISAMRPSLDNWTRVDCCIARSILNFFHVAYSGAFPSYCHILLVSYVNASFLFSYKMKWFTYNLNCFPLIRTFVTDGREMLYL